jgi:hypothetical protein
MGQTSWLVKIVLADGTDSVIPVRASSADEATRAARSVYRQQTGKDDDRMSLAIEWPLA